MQLNDSSGITWSNGGFLLQALSQHQYGWQLSLVSSSIYLYCLVSQTEKKGIAHYKVEHTQGLFRKGIHKQQVRIVDWLMKGWRHLMRKYSFHFFSEKDPHCMLDSTKSHPAIVSREKNQTVIVRILHFLCRISEASLKLICSPEDLSGTIRLLESKLQIHWFISC